MKIIYFFNTCSRTQFLAELYILHPETVHYIKV